MRKTMVKVLRMLGVTIIIVLLWASGFIDVPRLVTLGATEMRQWGNLPLMGGFLAMYLLKGRFTLFPSFGVITVNCALLPLWLGIPFSILGHTLGQTVCWYWGPASHCKGGKRLLPSSLDRKWKIMSVYFLIPQTDIALLELRTRQDIGDVTAILCGLPFIILADIIIVGSGNGVLHYLQSLIT